MKGLPGAQMGWGNHHGYKLTKTKYHRGLNFKKRRSDHCFLLEAVSKFKKKRLQINFETASRYF